MTTAAVLSVLVKANGVQQTQRELGGLDKTGSKAGKSLAALGKTASLGLAAGVAVGATAVKGFIDAAKASEVSTTKMKTQLAASGIEYGKHAKQIDAVIAKHSALSGFDDEDLQDSFTNIVRATGDVNEAMKLNALAMDIARGKGISLEAASKMVAKAADGQGTAFARAGIKMKEGASAQEAIAEAQKRFGGQAEAYGKTAAGAQERFGVAIENLQEKLGEGLLPIVTKVTGGIANFVTGMQTGEGAGGKFKDAIMAAFNFVKTGVSAALEFVKGFLEDHRDDLDAAAEAARNIGRAIQWAFETIILPVVQAVLPVIQGLVESTFKQIGGVINVIIGLLSGDFKRAWEGLKAIVEGAVEKMLLVLNGAWALFKVAGEGLIKAVVAGFKALPGLILDLGKWLFTHIDDAVKLYLTVFKTLGGWILKAIMDGLKAVPGLIVDAAKWIYNNIDDAIRLQIDLIKGIGGWILNRVVDGIRAAPDAILAVRWVDQEPRRGRTTRGDRGSPRGGRLDSGSDHRWVDGDRVEDQGRDGDAQGQDR